MVLLSILVFDTGYGFLVNLDAHPLENIPEVGHYADMRKKCQNKKTRLSSSPRRQWVVVANATASTANMS